MSHSNSAQTMGLRLLLTHNGLDFCFGETYHFFLDVVSLLQVTASFSSVVASDDALEWGLWSSLQTVGETFLWHSDWLISVGGSEWNTCVMGLSELVLFTSAGGTLSKGHLVKFLEVTWGGLLDTRVFMHLPIGGNCKQ